MEWMFTLRLLKPGIERVRQYILSTLLCRFKQMQRGIFIHPQSEAQVNSIKAGNLSKTERIHAQSWSEQIHQHKHHIDMTPSHHTFTQRPL